MHFPNMSALAAKCNGQICLFVENLEKSSLVDLKKINASDSSNYENGVNSFVKNK